MSRALLSLPLVLLVACASAPPARSAALDPANPAGPESPPLALATLAADPPPAEAPASAPPTAAEKTYTCPMHPEVVSDKPGRCPKCGMKLVPRKPDAGAAK